MAGSDLSGIGLSASESRGFTASPVDRGVHSEGSMAERGKAQTGESSNFMNVLKERVRAVIDAPHSSSPSISTVGSISHPTTTDVGSHRRAYAPSSDRPELQMLPLESAHGSVAMESDSGRTVRSAKLEDYYSIDWVPKELILKFRQQVEGFQVGANFEAKDYNTKLVFKPLRVDRKWKFICEPKYGDLRLLTKKISLGPLLNIQIGIGHDWHSHTTGWKWKVTSAFGGSGHTQMRHKSLFAVTPGFDVRVGWNAEYILPDLHGAVGTGDPTIGLNLGHLYASIERLEAIYTHMT